MNCMIELRWARAGVTALCLLTACVATARSRAATVKPVREVPGLDVSVAPSGNVGWQVNVRNTGSSSTKLVWDESTYVSTSGKTLGRLLRGQTKKIHSDRAQPPTPIPPGSTLSEWCVPEDHADVVGWGNPKVDNPEAAGRLILVFEFDGGQKKRWEGSVSYENAKK